MEYRSPSSSADSMSMLTNKKPFKWFEHPLSQFSDVVIPQRVDLLQKHRANIERFLQVEDYVSAKKEQMAAQILLKNLARDIADIDGLRSQVVEEELIKFDKVTEGARNNALRTLEEFLAFGKTVSKASKLHRPSQGANDLEGKAFSDVVELKGGVHLQVAGGSVDKMIREQEAYLQSWETLQSNAQDLHDMFGMLAEITKEQQELIGSIEENVAVTHEEVSSGANHLERAARYKAAMYPVVGALIGTCIGGPVGLIAGLKVGGLAAVGGGVFGFATGKLLKKKNLDRTSEDHNESLQKKSD